ncbi:MAG: hypothetical protein OEU97_03745 [Dehalococcoidia bacterium]|nr:hypothetical protein [Dehalococcoidia bacterium]MDH4299431.1 hypothetical protein [Dehalococcoidia bacterium]MDH4367656.1 hypothetical protein [Dehalococcoidia bacterium]
MGYRIGPEIDPISGAGFIEGTIFVRDHCGADFLQLHFALGDYRQHHNRFDPPFEGADEMESLEINIKVQ